MISLTKDKYVNKSKYLKILVEPINTIGIAIIPKNYVVFRKTKKKGEETHEFIGYYPKIDGAIKRMRDEILHRSASRKADENGLELEEVRDLIIKSNNKIKHLVENGV